MNLVELNERCNMELYYDDVEDQDISWITYDDRSEFTMTCTDSSE